MTKLLLLISARSNRNNLNSIDNIADHNGPKEDLEPKASLITSCSQPDSQNENEGGDHDCLFVRSESQGGSNAGQYQPTPIVGGFGSLIARPGSGRIHRASLFWRQTWCAKALESNIARQSDEGKNGH